MEFRIRYKLSNGMQLEKIDPPSCAPGRYASKQAFALQGGEHRFAIHRFGKVAIVQHEGFQKKPGIKAFGVRANVLDQGMRIVLQVRCRRGGRTVSVSPNKFLFLSPVVAAGPDIACIRSRPEPEHGAPCMGFCGHNTKTEDLTAEV